MFEEAKAGQVSKLTNLFGFEFALKNGYYTFSTLDDAPEYSILGGTFLGAPCIKTFEGKPWEVMRENGLVYDFVNDEVVPILTIVNPVKIYEASNYFLSNGMILPGSVTEDGSRVKDYAAHYLFDTAKFKYSEVSFE